MFLTLVEELDKMPKTAAIIISVALMLFVGFALTRITKRLRLPNVTAYIIAVLKSLDSGKHIEEINLKRHLCLFNLGLVVKLWKKDSLVVN
jgi:Kef-type K+ transport system membrane component KefB